VLTDGCDEAGPELKTELIQSDLAVGVVQISSNKLHLQSVHGTSQNCVVDLKSCCAGFIDLAFSVAECNSVRNLSSVVFDIENSRIFWQQVSYVNDVATVVQVSLEVLSMLVDESLSQTCVLNWWLKVNTIQCEGECWLLFHFEVICRQSHDCAGASLLRLQSLRTSFNDLQSITTSAVSIRVAAFSS
jgi:hypothetical protein